MIADAIKTATHTHHQSLEAIIIRKIKSIKSTEDYVTLLEWFYAYFGALEVQIKTHLETAGLDLANRRKAGDLANDLQSFKADPPAFAAEDELPVIDDHFSALGALYVIEGSTLGGKYISPMIAKKLNLEPGQGLSFFDGYGEETMQMWDDFKAFLNDQPKNETEEKLIIDAANQTFLKFEEFIETRNVVVG